MHRLTAGPLVIRLGFPNSLGQPIRLVICRAQIERIVTNLLENTAKYAPGSHVEVRVCHHGEQGFRMEVIDDGPGIPPAERERVFEAFHRGNANDPRPGTGIGLALVAEFARLHGGRAWAEPSDHGAHLVVEAPSAAP